MRFPYKPLLSISLIVQLLLPTICPIGAVAAQPADLSQSVTQQDLSAQLPEPLARNIRESIIAVYGQSQAEEIYGHVLRHIQRARQERPAELLKQDLARPSDWYKDEVIYMLYADRFGLKPGQTATAFKDLNGTLDYLQQLGVTTLYILPFMDSPMGDAGFDVRDYKSVRDNLGGLSGFQTFAREARKRGFKLKADLILNHVSDQHAWFQAALKGDQDKLHYFVVSDKEPQYRKYKDPEKGIVVDYLEDNGKISSRSLVFPDISNTQYREVSIQDKKYYFYHTFYPIQMDLNWQNPKVLYEILDIVSFWANQGIDIFRLDAVPYLVKPKGTNGENQPETLALIKLLSAYLEATAPASVLQAEAGQKLQDLLPYFGDEELAVLNIQGQAKPIRRTDRVQIAYNFPYMSAIWACLITQDRQQFWDVAGTTPHLPDSASWATFLRVHDELTLQMVEPNARAIIAEHLEPKGAEFRKGWGVSGRMANFLDQNPLRIQQAFSIMMSLPGIPIIYYGDEIGEVNNFEFARQYAKQREATQRQNNPNLDIISFYDSRDVNRGPLLKTHMEQALKQPNQPSGELFAAVKNMIQIRKLSDALKKGELTAINADQPSILAYLRKSDTQQVLVIHNLSGQPVQARLILPEDANQLSGQDSLLNLADRQRVSYQTDGNASLFQLEPYQSVWLLCEFAQ